MPLTKQQKSVAVDEIVGKLEGVPTIYLTNFQGLTVAEANDLRTRFRDAGVEFKVVKNTLLRQAMERLGGYDGLFDELHGPTAVAFSEEPAAPARVIKKFASTQDAKLPQLKGAFVDGAVFGADALDVLAALKSKDELIGDIVGLLLSPMSNIVGAINGQGSTLVAILQTLAERES